MIEADKAGTSGAPLKALLVLLGALDVTLILGSLRWPVPADAGVFHFVAAQLLQGAAPYRDLVDVNQPLIYWIHQAILLTGGAGDLAFRIFDLAILLIVASLCYLVCRPAGHLAAAVAAAFLIFLHLTFGAASAGQRDFILLIPLLASMLLGSWSATAGEARRRNGVMLAGAMIGVACLNKPTAFLAAMLPLAAAGRLAWRDVARLIVGAVLALAPALAILSIQGGLGALGRIWMEHGGTYANFDVKPTAALLKTIVGWGVRLIGFLVAMAVVFRHASEPRLRAAAALMIFGALHFLLQRKGYYYHLYPLICGVVCAGALGLGRMRGLRLWLCAALIAASAAIRVAPIIVLGLPTPATAHGDPDINRATQEMTEALSSRFPQHARIQTLDSDSGAFLAMARAGMRQASPQFYWFLLLNRSESLQKNFVDRLRRDPPDGFLLTETQWPVARGFEASDRWSDLSDLISQRYRLVASGESWRLYQLGR